jgi:hypothetical protein
MITAAPVLTFLTTNYMGTGCVATASTRAVNGGVIREKDEESAGHPPAMRRLAARPAAKRLHNDVVRRSSAAFPSVNRGRFLAAKIGANRTATPAHAGTSVHIPTRGDQRCLSLIAAWPVNPTLASGRRGRRLESGHPTRNCRSLDRLSGHTARRPSWAAARPRTRARIGRRIYHFTGSWGLAVPLTLRGGHPCGPVGLRAGVAAGVMQTIVCVLLAEHPVSARQNCKARCVRAHVTLILVSDTGRQ